jgi:hypothetical protein
MGVVPDMADAHVALKRGFEEDRPHRRGDEQLLHARTPLSADDVAAGKGGDVEAAHLAPRGRNVVRAQDRHEVGAGQWTKRYCASPSTCSTGRFWSTSASITP